MAETFGVQVLVAERGEVDVQLRDEDMYVLQPTGPTVNEYLIELLLLLDACRRWCANRLTAVIPYFGYARQDRRTRAGQPVWARVVAEAHEAAGAERLVVVDPHTAVPRPRAAHRWKE